MASHAETATAEFPCNKTTIVFDSLKKEYGEMPIITGKADDVANSIMSMWTNPITETWTIVATKGDLSCIIGNGSRIKSLTKQSQYM